MSNVCIYNYYTSSYKNKSEYENTVNNLIEPPKTFDLFEILISY